jgi:hypothetical protein
MMEGSRTVLLFKRGRLYAHAVILDGVVYVREFPVRAWWKPDEHGLRPMLLEGQAYPVDYAALRLIEAGAVLGITEGARRALVRLLPVPRNFDDPSH